MYYLYMPHFFVKSNSIKNNIIEVQDKELLKHLLSSLRIKKGEILSFFDENKIEYKTNVLEITKNYIKAEIIKKYPSNRFLKLDIYLMASILKQDAFFELISGVTQLGVKGLYPVYTVLLCPKLQFDNAHLYTILPFLLQVPSYVVLVTLCLAPSSGGATTALVPVPPDAHCVIVKRFVDYFVF